MLKNIIKKILKEESSIRNEHTVKDVYFVLNDISVSVNYKLYKLQYKKFGYTTTQYWFISNNDYMFYVETDMDDNESILMINSSVIDDIELFSGVKKGDELNHIFKLWVNDILNEEKNFVMIKLKKVSSNKINYVKRYGEIINHTTNKI